MLARPVLRTGRLCGRNYATSPAATTPPMLLKIRRDMKTAMQNKDTNRLSVLRGILATTLNASKTSNPISTDVQMLSLLRKSASAAKVASTEFQEAGRADLAEKEEAQAQIMEEYASGVEVLGDDEIRRVIEEVIAQAKAVGGKVGLGPVMKSVLAEERLGGQAVNAGDVAKMIKQILTEDASKS